MEIWTKRDIRLKLYLNYVLILIIHVIKYRPMRKLWYCALRQEGFWNLHLNLFQTPWHTYSDPRNYGHRQGFLLNFLLQNTQNYCRPITNCFCIARIAHSSHHTRLSHGVNEEHFDIQITLQAGTVTFQLFSHRRHTVLVYLHSVRNVKTSITALVKTNILK